MATITTAVAVELDVRDRAYILTTAVEGGTNYWAMVSQIERDENLLVLGVTFHDVEEDEQTVGRLTVTDNVVDLAVNKILAGEITAPGIRQQLLELIDEDPDEGIRAMDADAADAVVQVALLGDIVYG